MPRSRRCRCSPCRWRSAVAWRSRSGEGSVPARRGRSWRRRFLGVDAGLDILQLETAKVPCCRFFSALAVLRRNLASGSASVSVFSRHVPDPSVIVALERYRSRSAEWVRRRGLALPRVMRAQGEDLRKCLGRLGADGAAAMARGPWPQEAAARNRCRSEGDLNERPGRSPRTSVPVALRRRRVDDATLGVSPARDTARSRRCSCTAAARRAPSPGCASSATRRVPAPGASSRRRRTRRPPPDRTVGPR